MFSWHKLLVYKPWGGGGSGLHGTLYVVGWGFEKVCTYDGCYSEHSSTYHRYIFGNIISIWGNKWQFSFKMTQFLPIMGRFSTSFAPLMGVFFMICRGGCPRCGPHIRSNFPSGYPPPRGPSGGTWPPNATSWGPVQVWKNLRKHLYGYKIFKRLALWVQNLQKSTVKGYLWLNLKFSSDFCKIYQRFTLMGAFKACKAHPYGGNFFQNRAYFNMTNFSNSLFDDSIIFHTLKLV